MVKCDAHGIAACHSCSEYADHLERVNAALLEALEHSLDWLASYPGGGAAVAYDKARAAIAQAKGETK